jgi:hypothetical protein
VRSDDGAQKLATKHVIKVMAILNPEVNYHAGGTFRTPDGDMRLSIQSLRDYLLQDRKQLEYAVGGLVVVESTGSLDGLTFASDSFQGPKPLYVQITQITGTTTCYVRFGIECWTDHCITTTVNGKVTIVQSHRWSMVHDVDGDTWLTTRMVSGQVKFRPEAMEWARQALGEPFKVPDQILKPHFFHPIPPGFKRQNVRVQAHPNGMELAYSFTDVEQVLPLGSLSPSTKLTAEFSLGTSLAEGKPAVTQAMVHVAAVGPKNQYRFNLLIMAIRIALRKLQKPGLLFVQELQINYSLDQLFVDLSIRAVWKPVAAGLEGLQLNDTGLRASDDHNDLNDALAIFRADGEPLQASQSHLAKAPASSFDGRKGTYLGLCVGSAIVDGCFLLAQPANWVLSVENKKMEVEFGPDPDQEILKPLSNNGAELPFDLELTDALTIPLYSTGLSALATDGPGLYEDWAMTTRYHTSHQKAVLPIGRAVPASPGDDIGVYSQPQVATLGLPYTLKSVDWTVAYIGPDPAGILLPSPDSGDTNDVLLAEDITPAVPMIVNSSHKSWRVSGTFWYVSKRLRTSSATVVATFPSLGVDQGFSPGKSITDPNDRQSNTIGQSRFVAGYSPSYMG